MPERRNFFPKARKPDTKPQAIHSEAQSTKGQSVQRKRFQKGSVYLNAMKKTWVGAYCECVLDAYGIEKRVRKQITLSPVKTGDTKIIFSARPSSQAPAPLHSNSARASEAIAIKPSFSAPINMAAVPPMRMAARTQSLSSSVRVRARLRQGRRLRRLAYSLCPT